jgi:hypothetical protein
MNKLYQFIITSPAIAIPAVQKIVTISSPDKGSALHHLTNQIEAENKNANYSLNMVEELDAEKFLKDLSLTRPSVMELKVEEKKPKDLQALIAYIKSQGYSVKKLTKKV